MAKKAKNRKLKTIRSFSSAQLLMFVLVFAAVGGVVIWRSLAAPSNKKQSNSPLALVSEGIANPQTPPAPTTCLNEDDQDDRYYTGSLSGSFSSTYTMCNEWSGGQLWTAGGEGIEAEVNVVGTFNDLTISTPSGEVRHAVFVSASTYKGVTTSKYTVCYCPPFSLSTHTGTDPLAGGNYTLTLSGQISKAQYTTRADMAYPDMFQLAYCPPSQQNLTP